MKPQYLDICLKRGLDYPTELKESDFSATWNQLFKRLIHQANNCNIIQCLWIINIFRTPKGICVLFIIFDSWNWSFLHSSVDASQFKTLNIFSHLVSRDSNTRHAVKNSSTYVSLNLTSSLRRILVFRQSPLTKVLTDISHWYLLFGTSILRVVLQFKCVGLP